MLGSHYSFCLKALSKPHLSMKTCFCSRLGGRASSLGLSPGLPGRVHHSILMLLKDFGRTTIGDLQCMYLCPLEFPESYSLALSILVLSHCPDNAWLTVRTDYIEIGIYSRAMLYQDPKTVFTFIWSIQCTSMEKRKSRPFKTGFQSCSAMSSFVGDYRSCCKNHLQFIGFCTCWVWTFTLLFLCWRLKCAMMICLYSGGLGINPYLKAEECGTLTSFPPWNSH